VRDEELPIIRSFYDFVLWVSPKIAKFPRDRRFVLGERLELGAGHRASDSRRGLLRMACASRLQPTGFGID